MARPLPLLALLLLSLAGCGDDDPPDMTGTDAGSRPREDSLAECMNSVDDDMDGDTDCDDFACAGYEHCRMPPPPPDDGGPPPMVRDSGPRPPRRDSGPDVDSGPPPLLDSGLPKLEDAGPPGHDGGSIDFDAGLPGIDAAFGFDAGL